MRHKELKITREVAIVLPTRPNFIKIGEKSFSIGEIDEATLQKIAAAWGQALLAEAKEKREQPIPRGP